MIAVRRFGLSVWMSLLPLGLAQAAIPGPAVPAPDAVWNLLDSPRAVAATADGGFWVIEQGAQRLRHFVPGIAASIIVGSFGNGDGQFQWPAGVAVSPSGDFFVTDQATCRVSRFTASGVFVTAWSGPGAGPGQLVGPAGIACAPNGDVYVSDQFGHRVVRFSAEGAFLGQWGSQGSAPGQLDSPSGIAVDRHGSVYVADLQNHRIQKFSPMGHFLRTWGSNGAAPGQFSLPAGVAVDEWDRVHVSEAGGNRVQVFTSSGAWLAQYGSQGGASGQFKSPVGIAILGNGDIVVAEQAGTRVQSFRGSGQFEIGPAGVRTITFPVIGSSLSGISEGPNGDLYVSHFYGHALYRFSHGGVLRPPNGGFGNPGGALYPMGVATDDSGHVFTLEYGSGHVRKFDADGNRVAEYPGPGPSGQLAHPIDLIVQEDGMLLVSDWPAIPTAYRYTPGGLLQGGLTLSGNNNGNTIAQTVEGDLYTFDERVVSRRSAGGTLRWGRSLGIVSNNYFGAGGIATDRDGGVCVLDRTNSLLLRFDSEGRQYGQTPAAELGQSDGTPGSRLTTDHQGNVLIAWAGGAIARVAIAPRLRPVVDVPSDGGRQVLLRFAATSADAAVTDAPVVQYEVHRRLDAPLPPDANPDPSLPGWELVAVVPATGASEYQVQVPTREDALPGSISYTAFRVRAKFAGITPLSSATEYGYSLDQLAAPSALEFAGVYAGDGVRLHWTSPPGSDAVAWVLHRGADPSFEPAEDNLIATVPDTVYTDPGPNSLYYKLASVDAAGNVSGFSSVGPEGTLDVPEPASAMVFALARLRPNPLRGGPLEIDFTLAGRGNAAVELLDVAGRRVMRRDLPGLSSGPHHFSLAPERALSPGLYMLRLSDGRGAERVARVVVLD